VGARVLDFHCWTGKFEFRLTSNISAVDQAIEKKFHVEKLTIEFYTLVKFAPPAVHHSAARWPKTKTFPPKFLENGKADRHHSRVVDTARLSEKNSGICPFSFLGLGGGVPPKK